MPIASPPRIIIAGTGSGCGKTTITCGIIGALQNRNAMPRAFKCGPDYIDPMFHTKILGVPSRNIDSFLCSEQIIKYLFARNSPEHSIAIIEGVMGFYDGVAGSYTKASTHEISQILSAPVILVANCKGKSVSLAAEIKGYKELFPNNIVGVIINGANENTYPMYKNIVEEFTGLQVLGYMPIIKEANFESRHLGLISTSEIKDIRYKMDLLANQAEKSIDLDAIIKLASVAKPIEYDNIEIPRLPVTIPIAIARDAAFSFYYKDSLELLERMGAKLIPFSPLVDEEIPKHACGLLLGGGYPELSAHLITRNRQILDCLFDKIIEGMPTIAECGGFMVLCNDIISTDGKSYKMAGLINTSAHMTEKLSRFGYVKLTASKSNLLCDYGQQINAHEFHYSKVDDYGDGFNAVKLSGKSWDCVHVNDTLYAGYPHINLWSNISSAWRFMNACMKYKNQSSVGGAT